jgi:subtilisin-like proprotein convertase family protein/V8-like Glu-specific endopeptidase
MKTNQILSKLFLAITIGSLLTACAEDTDQEKSKPKKLAAVQDEHSIDAKVIYGDDNRHDIYDVTDSTLLKLANSTLALISNNDLTPDNNGDYSLDQTTFGQTYGLCASEPFREQNNVAFCSGFLVGPRLVATAGHCVRATSDCSGTKFVFGYAVRAQNVNPKTVKKDDVYSCKKIIHSEVQNLGRDYALVELDRDVVGHAPLAVRRTGSVTVGDDLIVIGHPAGLPTKVADGAQVRKIESAYFVANLDTYGGNSGSAVFNKRSGEVEGILVRGEKDFVTQNNCKISYRCTDTSCRGEDVTKITEAIAKIPALTSEPNEPPPAQYKIYSSATKISIPDNNVLGASSSVVTDEAPRGRKVYVQVNISHTWRGDLYVSLVSPEGVEHVLANRQGRGTKDLIGVFGKDLVADLSGAAQVNRAGIWTLRVSDRALRDIGQINSWSLIFE